MTWIFGEPLPHDVAEKLNRPKGRTDRAHAALPGTGPDGETCGSCKFLVRFRQANAWFKCGLREKQWTGGHATDICKKDLACRHWEKKP